MERHQIKNGWYIWEPHFFQSNQADQHYKKLLSDLNWQSGAIKIFGKIHPIPRKQVLFADEGHTYGYSGKELTVENWNQTVFFIKKRIEDASGFEFNACLANLYRNGQDSNGWHADNERELGKNPVIASVSLGETRKFQLKHQITKQRIDIPLKHGSLLIMGGEMQHFWKHQIPKTKKVVEPRVNLTFRKLIK